MNKILVEHGNDSNIIKSLFKHFDNDNSAIFDDNSFVSLGSIDDFSKSESATNLTNHLNNIKEIISKSNDTSHTIGFLIDLDNENNENRINYVNKAITNVFQKDNIIKEINNQYTINFNNSNVIFCCYFINVDGNGNIETLLKAITTKDSIFANCLYIWQNCFEQKGNKMKKSDFDKFWIHVYIRYDTCSNKESGNADENCNIKKFDNLINKGIFDLNSKYLNDLKIFHSLFK